MAISRRRTCDLKTCEGLIEAYCKIPGGEYHTLQGGSSWAGIVRLQCARAESRGNKGNPVE